MQGQKGVVGSAPETISINHGSTSSDTGIDHQPICWTSLPNPREDILAEYMIPSNTIGTSYMSPATNQERQNFGAWTLGESSSGASLNQPNLNEQKLENRWTSSMNACVGAARISEERRYESSNILSLDNANETTNRNFLIQNSSSDGIRQGININLGSENHENGDTERPNALKCAGPADNQMPSESSSSNPFGNFSAGGGYLEEDRDSRSGISLDGRRVACKRKALEGNVGQSSGSGSSNLFQHGESDFFHNIDVSHNVASSISLPPEHNIRPNFLGQVNPSLGLSVGRAASESPFAFATPVSGENSHRNFRLRTNGSHQHGTMPQNVVSSGANSRNANVSSALQHSSIPIQNNSLDLRTSPADSGGHVLHDPALRGYSYSRWSGASSSRTESPSIFSVSEEGDAALPEGFTLRNVPQHLRFPPVIEMPNSTQNPSNWNVDGRNINIPGDVGSSSSQLGSDSAIRSSSPSWVPRRTPHYSRRLSEFVRRSWPGAAASGSGGQSSINPASNSGPNATSQDVSPAAGSSSQGRRSQNSRSLMLERHLEGAFGGPYSLRTLASEGGRRSRLVSEIRNALDLMRRGEGLRFEDVMILDQSVFFGMVDLHDRHRDMRLDVDNMSYEELLALEERIGNVCTGLSEEVIMTRLKQCQFISKTTCEVETEPCCVCQEEYNDGEDLGTLDCGHDFHTECIKQWLMQKNLCPICKTTGLAK